MQTKLSTKGQVVLPQPVRRQLGLRPGDTLDIRTEGSSVILTARRERVRKARLIKDPITGGLVITAGRGAPTLTSEQVRDMLADFHEVSA